MKLSTKIKLFFSGNLADSLSCVGCELPCSGKYYFKKAELCRIMVDNYERKSKGK